MQCTPSSPVTGNEIIATATATARRPLPSPSSLSPCRTSFIAPMMKVSKVCPDRRRGAAGARAWARPGPPRPSPLALALFPVPQPSSDPSLEQRGRCRVVGRFLGTLPPLSSFLVNCSTMRKTVQRTGKCGSQQRTDAVDRPLPNKKTFPSISPSLDWSSSLPDLDLGMALHLEHGFHSGHFVRKTATKMLP